MGLKGVLTKLFIGNKPIDETDTPSDGQVATYNNSKGKWDAQTIPSQTPTLTKQEFMLGSNFTTTSTTFVDVTAFTLTIANNTGKFMAHVQGNVSNNTLAATTGLVLNDGGTSQEPVGADAMVANNLINISLGYVGDNDGQVLKLQMNVSGGTGTLYANDLNFGSSIQVLEIS